MSDRIRFGVIGVGSWANRIQIPQVLSHPQAELVALSARTQRVMDAVLLSTDERRWVELEELP